MQKQENASARLVADAAFLFRAGRACQQQAGAARSRRPHQHPPLAATQGCVFDEVKSEGIGVVGDGFVVISDDDGDMSDGLAH